MHEAQILNPEPLNPNLKSHTMHPKPKTILSQPRTIKPNSGGGGSGASSGWIRVDFEIDSELRQTLSFPLRTNSTDANSSGLGQTLSSSSNATNSSDLRRTLSSPLQIDSTNATKPSITTTIPTAANTSNTTTANAMAAESGGH
jgi:hypothetical protein